MKKNILFLAFSIIGLTTGLAQVNTIDPINPSTVDVVGPVKQLTVFQKIGIKNLIIVRQYDAKGRLTKHEDYNDGELYPNGFVRQYTDSNVCWEYDYDSKIASELNYSKIMLDTAGREISKTYFRGGKLFGKDSIVYDSKGRKIRDYQSIPKNKNLLRLCHTYEYDTLNRLVRMRRCLDDYWLTVNYLPNGNYKMNYTGKHGSNSGTYFVNSNGQLEKINERNNIYTYFSDFDRYGNWLRQKHEYVNGQHASTVERKIEYYSPQENDSVYLSTEQLPEFPGGQNAMFQYISDNIIYPFSAYSNGVHGRTVCQFVVNKSGDLVDCVVVKSSGDISLDQEAVRVLSAMPKWNPGQSAGEIVRVKCTVPVTFKLPEHVWKQDSVNVADSDSTIFVVVNEMPEFPHGNQALFDYLSRNIRYPKKAKGATGRVFVQFVVEKDGEISNAKIAKSSGNEFLDAETIRLVNKMPKWKPGKLKGVPVRVRYVVPVKFENAD